MPNFSEELQQARVERGLTQEELANLMNVSRQTISHWENSRAVPDIDTIKLLSSVLEHDFFAAEKADGRKEDPNTENRQASPVPDKSRRKTVMIYILAAAVCLLLGGLLFMGINEYTEPAQPTYRKYSYEWYQTDPPRIKDAAYISIYTEDDVLHAIPSDDDPDGPGWWRYLFYINAENGISFTVENIRVHYFMPDHSNIGSDEYGPTFFEEHFGSRQINMGYPLVWVGGFGVQETSAVGLSIEGTDENGNRLVFWELVDLDPDFE